MEQETDTLETACKETQGQEQPARKRCTAERIEAPVPRRTAAEAAVGDERPHAPPEETDSCEETEPKRRKETAAAHSKAFGLTAEGDAKEQTPPVHAEQPGEALATGECTQESGGVHTLRGGILLQDKNPCCPNGAFSLSPAEMFHNAWILAPMVRISTLPFRLECLKYGADLVYSEEIVDRKLLDAKRHVNKDFNTVEYVSETDRRCVFATCGPEKGRVVLQLGTASAPLALQAATRALQDVAAVDINMGCPKSFSCVCQLRRQNFISSRRRGLQCHSLLSLTSPAARLSGHPSASPALPKPQSGRLGFLDWLHARRWIGFFACVLRRVKGGMGAALLQTPEVAMDILKTLRRNLSCPVTCKIRLLDTLQETVDFVRQCESTGVAAIAVHARKRHERPAHRANWQAFSTLRDALKIPLIANGDFLSSEDAAVFQETYGIRNLMFARGAMWDPSLFSHKPGLQTDAAVERPSSRMQVLQDYIKRAVRCGAVYQSIKFTLQEMTARDSNRELKLQLVAANSTAKICSAFGLDGFYSSIAHVPYANTLSYYKGIELS